MYYWQEFVVFRKKAKPVFVYTPVVVDLDATPAGQDWLKGTWDLPMPGTPEYDGLVRFNGGEPLRPSVDAPDGIDTTKMK